MGEAQRRVARDAAFAIHDLGNAVCRYMELPCKLSRRYADGFKLVGEDLAWVIRQTGPGKQTKVVFGPHQLAEHEFQLFAYKT